MDCSTGVWDQRVYRFRHLGLASAKVRIFFEWAKNLAKNLLRLPLFACSWKRENRVIAGDMMRQTLFLRGIYASGVVAGSTEMLRQMQYQRSLYASDIATGSTDMLRKMQYQRSLYASDVVASGAIVKRSRHPQEAVTQTLRPFSASLRWRICAPWPTNLPSYRWAQHCLSLPR